MDSTSPRRSGQTEASGIPWRYIALSALVLAGVATAIAGWALARATAETDRTAELGSTLRGAAAALGDPPSAPPVPSPLDQLLDLGEGWVARHPPESPVPARGMRGERPAEISAALLRLDGDLRRVAPDVRGGGQGPHPAAELRDALPGELLALAAMTDAYLVDARATRSARVRVLVVLGIATPGLLLLAVQLLLVHPLRRRESGVRREGAGSLSTPPSAAPAPSLVQEVEEIHRRVTEHDAAQRESTRDRAVLRELQHGLRSAETPGDILDTALSALEWCLGASEVLALLRPDLRRRLKTPGRRRHLGERSTLSGELEAQEWEALVLSGFLPGPPSSPSGRATGGDHGTAGVPPDTPVVIPLGRPPGAASTPLGVLVARYPGGGGRRDRDDRPQPRGELLEQIEFQVGAALTERVALCEARETRDRHFELFDRLPIPLFLLDSEGVLERTNHAFRTLFELPGPDASAGSSPQGTPRIRLAELCEEGDALAPLRRLGAASARPPGTGSLTIQETSAFRTRQGRSFMGELSVTRHDPGSPENQRILGSVRDLSHQLGALSDARTLSQALLQIDTALCIADHAGRVRFANPAFETMMGMTGEALLGRFFDEPTLPYQELTGSARGLLDRLLEGEIIRGERTAVRRGEERLEARTITPIRNAEGKVTHIVSLSRDITADRSLEEQFHHAQKLDAVGRLAGGVAHDFNNLLTVIQGHVYLILAQLEADDPVREDLEGMMQASSRAGALVEQLLTFSRKAPGVPSALEVAGVLSETESLLRRLLPGHVTLRSSTPRVLPEVAIDQSHLEQILVNLVVNARDAMSEGGTIELASWAETRAGEGPERKEVCLRVRDSGSGIPPDVRERIFEPFFTTKAQGKGTGLGLSTVYGIVTQAGGTIEVESVMGQGTTFTIRLPAAEPGVDLAFPATPRARGAESNDRSYRGVERILLVEDHDLVRSVTRSILKDFGYAVDEATTAEDAMELFQADEPGGDHDLVITDLVLPGLGGAHLARQLRSRSPAFPVIFISGYRGMDDHEPTEIPGDPIPMVGKPFTVAELMQAVRRALDAPRPSLTGVGSER
jgi:two-component system, cell cycle sensor histidine kinase and response regulator CckA